MTKIDLIKPSIVREGRWLLGGDWHSWYYDRRGIRLLFSIAKYFPWAGAVLMGDIHDFYQVSRYDKDPARGNNMQKELNVTIELLKQFRACLGPDAVIKLLEGNHERRLEKGIRRHMPGMASLDTNTVVRQLHLGDLGIELVPYDGRFYLAPGYLLKHGAGKNDDGCEYSGFAAYTARKNLEKFWCSGASAHTHRRGTYSVTKRGKTYTWDEIGCLCDRPKVGRDYANEPNWQLGCLEAIVDGRRVFPLPIAMDGGRCVVEGKEFRA